MDELMKDLINCTRELDICRTRLGESDQELERINKQLTQAKENKSTIENQYKVTESKVLAIVSKINALK